MRFLAPLCQVAAELFYCRVVHLSVRHVFFWGRGQSHKRFSKKFIFGRELLWDDINHISKDRFD